MAFRVGQKVVCIQAGPIFAEPGERSVREGTIYTVRGLVQAPEGAGVYLDEVRNPAVFCTMGVCERAFPRQWFRPVVERKTDTGFAILTEILNGQRVPEVTS